MADDTPQETGPRRDEETVESARRSRTPPTIDLEASRVETGATDGADAAASPSRGGATFASRIFACRIFASKRATVFVALAAGAMVACVVIAMAWVAGGRGGPAALDPSTIATLETLGARLARLEEAPPPVARPDPAQLARLDSIDKALAAERDALGTVRTQLDGLGQAVDALKAAPREAVAAPASEQPAIDPRLGEIEATLKSLSDEVARLRDAGAKSEAAAAAASKQGSVGDVGVRRAVAALALDAAVRQGAPFAAELAAARASGLDASALQPLQGFADAGLADPAALLRDLVALLPQPTPEPASEAIRGGWFERLTASAARLVRIRRVEPGEGDGDELHAVATAARHGDLAEARRAIAALPETARAKFQPWLDRVTAREAALAAVRRVTTDAVAAMSNPVTAKPSDSKTAP
jgi:hypothetical protein